MYSVDLPDGTFASGTWNFPFAYLCCVQSVMGHSYFYRKLKDSRTLR